MRIRLEHTATGFVLPVKAHPGAKKSGITGEHAGALKVSVTQAPEKGKANEAIIKLLANELRLKKAQITLASGATSTSKQFVIADADIDSIRATLQAILN